LETGKKWGLNVATEVWFLSKSVSCSSIISYSLRIVFWDVLPCKIIVDQRCRPDDEGSTHLWNVDRQLFYTAVHPRRQFWTSYSPPSELEISHRITSFTDMSLFLSLLSLKSERRLMRSPVCLCSPNNFWTDW
jgi:hypothetical protein